MNGSLFSKHCFCSLKQNILQSFHIRYYIGLSVARSTFAKTFRPNRTPTWPMLNLRILELSIADYHFNWFFCKLGILSLSIDGEKQHSSLNERPCKLKFLTIVRFSSHNYLFNRVISYDIMAVLSLLKLKTELKTEKNPRVLLMIPSPHAKLVIWLTQRREQIRTFHTQKC